MNEIIRHIEYLLVTNDCVTVPGLGAVIAHSMPAKFMDDGSVIMPPSRLFSFNPSLVHNDGLLVSSVARSKEISYDSARRSVADEVELMKRILSSSGRLSLGRVGALTMSAEGVMTFETSDGSALSPGYFWLPSLDLQTVGQLARRRSNAAVAQRIARPGFFVRAARVAASVAILFALGLMLSTPIDVGNAQYASLGVENFKPTSPDNNVSELMRRPGESSAPLVLVFDRHSDASEVVDTAAHNQYIRQRLSSDDRLLFSSAEHNDSQLRFNDSDSYCVIVASLASQNEANEFIAKSENKKLGILSKDGRFRVYAATGSNSQQAQSAAHELAEQYPGAWVCRK